MYRISYCHGRYIPHYQAVTHINDRGYQFSDGVYEVIIYTDHSYWDIDHHLKRLRQSLEAFHIHFTMSDNVLKLIIQTLIEKNKCISCIIYLQITRGVLSPRQHMIPSPDTAPKDFQPVLTISCLPIKKEKLLAASLKKISLYSTKDKRHKICDIKTTALMPNILALKEAHDHGYDDVIFINQEDHITEGHAWNIWLVTKNNIIKTPFADNTILHGIMRQRIFNTARSLGLKVEESHIYLQDLYNAKEVFLSSSAKIAQSAYKINDIILSQETDITNKLRSQIIKDLCSEI